MSRKGFYEELRIKEYIAEMTPLMCKYVMDVMQGADDRAKENLVAKLLPKIIDKGLPTMITGGQEGDNPISILFNVRRDNGLTQNSSAEKENQSDPGGDSSQ